MSHELGIMPAKKKAAKKKGAQPTVKKRAIDFGQSDAQSVETELAIRTGMPAPDSVISETTFVSPKGNVYRILKTNETDDYDKSPPPQKKRSRRR
jgi:hypothetical protein